jgi:hypothetical protein
MPEVKKPGSAPENAEPAVEIIPGQTPQPREVKEIEIDAKTGEPVKAEPQTSPSLSQDEVKKLTSRMEFQARQNERLTRELQNAMGLLQQNRPAPVQAEKPGTTDDEFDPELDAIAKTDYQRALRITARKEAEKIAEKQFKVMWEKRETEQRETNARQNTMLQLEREKSWVLERTPSLDDETSDEFKTYAQVRNKMLIEDPTLVSNPRAPRLIWYEWQESMKPKENQRNSAESQEAERRQRVAGTASPQGRAMSGNKTIKLTQEQLDFCKRNKISPAAYAEANQANLKEGISA